VNPEDEDIDLSGIDYEPDPDAITLDLVELRGRRRGEDTPEDVAESIARKGEPMRGVGDLVEAAPGMVGRGLAREIRTRRDVGEAGASALANEVDEALGITRLANRAGDVPAIGEALDSWLDSGTAGTTGAVSGLTSGFGDEIAGTGSAALATLAGEDADAAYRETRDRMREDYARARRESPVMTGLGELAGGVAQGALIPALPRGGGLMSAVGASAAEGALMGGLAGVGHSEAEDASGMLGDAVEGAGYGALTGGVMGGVGYGVGRGVDALRRFGDRADDLRVGAALSSGRSPLSTRAERDVAALPGGTRAAADYLRRVGPRIGTVTDTAEALEEAVTRSGEDLGRFSDVLDEAMPTLPVDRFTGPMDRVTRELAGDPGLAESVVARPSRVAGDWRRAADAGPSPGSLTGPAIRRGMRTMRSGVDHVAAAEGVPAAEAELDILRELRRAYDDAADEALGDGVGEAYRRLRNEHAIGSTLERYALPAAMREARSPGGGLTGAMLEAGERARGSGIIRSFLTGEARGALRRRWPSIVATTAETVRGALGSGAAGRLGEYARPLGNALRRGSESFMAAHEALMGSDPEYAEMVEGLEEPMPTTVEEFDEWYNAVPAEEPAETTEEPMPTTVEEFDAWYNATN
jgi:hypothetical protein